MALLTTFIRVAKRQNKKTGITPVFILELGLERQQESLFPVVLVHL